MLLFESVDELLVLIPTRARTIPVLKFLFKFWEVYRFGPFLSVYSEMHVDASIIFVSCDDLIHKAVVTMVSNWIIVAWPRLHVVYVKLVELSEP